jgi:outer membrane protein assembly factor BamD
VIVRSRAAALAALAAPVLAFALAACGNRFELKKYEGSTDRLYAASLEQFQRHHWDEAAQGFERLTLDLPAHDTLLPSAYYYLGRAHERQHEPLLAAQSFARLAEGFPDDTLAPFALYESGKAYSTLWRRPDLDPQYGQSALSEFQQLVALYPTSSLKDASDRQISRLQNWFATKDFQTGLHYYRRRAYDSAIIYFKDVVKNYPSSPVTRRAYLRLVDTYRAIRYRDDARDVCNTLLTTYPQDREVRSRCGSSATASAQQPPS